MENKNIVVIGAGKGIGLETVRALHGQGAHVYAVSKTPSAGLEELGITAILWDSRSEDFSALATIPTEIHGLVYCPGSINLKPFHRLSKQDFVEDFQQNVLGAVGVIQHFLPSLKKVESASVVLFSTVASKLGMPYHASIAASKSAVEGLTKTLAAEYSANKIRFNCIAPSLSDTGLAEKLLANDEKKEAAAQRHPIKEVGDPREIAALVKFLLSEQAGWITGQIIGVDGGLGAVKV